MLAIEVGGRASVDAPMMRIEAARGGHGSASRRRRRPQVDAGAEGGDDRPPDRRRARHACRAMPEPQRQPPCLQLMPRPCAGRGARCAFAPTAAAAAILGDAIGETGETVKRATLAGETLVTEARGRGEVWIVDEASMAGTRDITRMLLLAERAAARIVLVGDVEHRNVGPNRQPREAGGRDRASKRRADGGARARNDDRSAQRYAGAEAGRKPCSLGYWRLFRPNILPKRCLPQWSGRLKRGHEAAYHFPVLDHL